MPDLRIETVSQIYDVVRLATEFSSHALAAAVHDDENALDGASRIWYRGVGSIEYELLPALYRTPPTDVSVDDRVDREAEMLNAFAARSLPYSTLRPNSDWEQLFLMQHYGLPTRLLDWSESPLTALYFALTSSERREFEHDAAIWFLNPSSWNQGALTYMAPPGSILSDRATALDGFKPGVDKILMSDKTVAMYALHNSPRIVAQRGTFTVFGLHEVPMEKMYADLDTRDDTLLSLIIPKADAPRLLNELASQGIGRASVFPSLESLADDIRREFGF